MVHAIAFQKNHFPYVRGLVLLYLSKHLALQLQTFVFLCCCVNRYEVTSHLTREMEPFSLYVFVRTLLHMGVFWLAHSSVGVLKFS